MASFHSLAIDPAPFKADTDLSAAVNTAGSNLYRVVAAASTSNNIKLATGASNPYPLGVLQNSPSAGQEAEVRVLGFSLVTGRVNGSGCNLVPGRFVLAASDGCVESASLTTCLVFGRWMSASFGTAGGSVYGELQLFGMSVCAAAIS